MIIIAAAKKAYELLIGYYCRLIGHEKELNCGWFIYIKSK
jgi:hypothetical protein